MLFINKKNRIVSIGLSTMALLFLTACSTNMDNKISEKINEKNSDKTEESTEKKSSENFKMSEEQKKLLSKAESQTAEDALKEDKKVEEKEVSLKVPDTQDKFEDPNSFSQYISHLLFLYYSNEINGAEFYKKTKKYMSTDFLNSLPKHESERIDTFTELQKLFNDQITSPVQSYQLTKLTINERAKEATFYRKFTLANGERIYYKTSITKEDDYWLLNDDKPSANYEVENTNIKFKQNKGA